MGRRVAGADQITPGEPESVLDSTADALDKVVETNTSPAYERWVEWTGWPLLVAALLFMLGYSLPILRLDLPDAIHQLCRWTVWGTWGLFVIDYGVRFLLVPKKWRFILGHWLDLMFIVVPLLRPLALLRLLTVFVVLDRHAGTRLRSRAGLYVAGGTALVVFAASVAVLDVERAAPGSQITDFGQAIWWACTTVTTVGYGDVVPVTIPGRIIAVALMVCGVLLFAVVTASFSTWFIEVIQRGHTAPPVRDRKATGELASLRAEIERLEERLAERRTSS